MVLGPSTLRLDVVKGNPILDAADKAEPKIRRALLSAFGRLSAAVPDTALQSGDVNTFLAMLRDLHLPDEMYATITTAMADAATTAGAPTAAKLGMSFNRPNVRALSWASMNAARQVQVPLALQAVIRDSVMDGMARGLHHTVIARGIQGDLPLTARHAKAVERLFQSSLDSGVTLSHAEKIRSRKQAKLLRWRANTIARTESVRAANMGQQLVWEQATDLNYIPKGTKKIWRTNIDDSTCEICLPLNGEPVPVGTEFSTNSKTPPAHPNCRCYMTLETL